MAAIPSESNSALLLNISLQPHDLTPEQARALQQYTDTDDGIIGRQMLVPNMMRLHSLHYAIQKAFGWQNKSPHRFVLPAPEFDAMTNGLFREWQDLVGVYFRVPGAPLESYYPSEEPVRNQTFEAWLKHRYSGPYSWDIGTYFEHLVTARLFLTQVMEAGIEQEIASAENASEDTEQDETGEDTDSETSTEPRIILHRPDWNSLTTDAAQALLRDSMRDLIERTRVGQILCPPEVQRVTTRQLDRIAGKAEIASAVGQHMTYPITVEISDHVQEYEKGNMPLDVLELQDTYERVLSETDLSTIPATSTLDYYYDPTAQWHLQIDCIETYMLEGYEPGKLPTRLYTVTDHTGAEVIEEVQAIVSDVILENHPLCTGVLGPYLMEDSKGLAGFADFLTAYNSRKRDDKARAQQQAKRVDWTPDTPDPIHVM